MIPKKLESELRARNERSSREVVCCLMCLFMPACSSDLPAGGGEASARAVLQDTCVTELRDFSRDLADGARCTNHSYTHCSGFASNCTSYCAFEICQPEPCSSNGDCTWLGASFECRDYVIDSESFGHWCDLSDCPKGSMGCPCRDDQTCDPDPYSSDLMTCTSENTCDSSCPAQCRVGSICCGFPFCAGDCAFSPCCL